MEFELSDTWNKVGEWKFFSDTCPVNVGVVEIHVSIFFNFCVLLYHMCCVILLHGFWMQSLLI